MGFRFMEDSSYTMENETNLTATPKALSSSIHGIVERNDTGDSYLSNEHPVFSLLVLGMRDKS